MTDAPRPPMISQAALDLRAREQARRDAYDAQSAAYGREREAEEAAQAKANAAAAINTASTMPPPAQPSFPAPANSCNVLGLLNSGSAFASTAIGAAASVRGNLSLAANQLRSLPNLIADIPTAIVNQLVNTVSVAVNGAIVALEAHLAQQITNLVKNLTLAVSHGAAQAGLAGSGGGCSLGSFAGATDPCDPMKALFGSLTGGAESLLNKITAQLNMLTSFISGVATMINGVITDLLSAVNSIIGAIAGIANQISAFIAAEIAALGNMIAELLNFAHVSNLFGLINNKCAKQVLASVGTPALKTGLGM